MVNKENGKYVGKYKETFMIFQSIIMSHLVMFYKRDKTKVLYHSSTNQDRINAFKTF